MLASTFLRFNYLPLVSGGQGASAVALRETVIVRVQAGGDLDVNGTAVALAELPATLNKWADKGVKRGFCASCPAHGQAILSAPLLKRDAPRLITSSWFGDFNAVT